MPSPMDTDSSASSESEEESDSEIDLLTAWDDWMAPVSLLPTHTDWLTHGKCISYPGYVVSRSTVVLLVRDGADLKWPPVHKV